MTDILTLMSSPMNREQKLELALKMARSWMHCVEARLLDTPNFRRDMEALDTVLSTPKAEAVEPFGWQWREGRSTRHAPDVWDWSAWRDGRLPAHVENREYRRYEERAFYASPIHSFTTEAPKAHFKAWRFAKGDTIPQWLEESDGIVTAGANLLVVEEGEGGFSVYFANPDDALSGHLMHADGASFIRGNSAGVCLRTPARMLTRLTEIESYCVSQAITDEAVERAVDAIEGELGGFSATREQARAILEYALRATFPSKGE